MTFYRNFCFLLNWRYFDCISQILNYEVWYKRITSQHGTKMGEARGTKKEQLDN